MKLFDSTHIPQSLRALPRWIAWRYQQREGKTTKVPLDPRTGELADAMDRSIHLPFGEALAAIGRLTGLVGLGFVFMPEDGFVGVDLDGCINDKGELVPAAREIVDDLNSYCETSPSKLGVKVFLKATKPDWAACRSRAIVQLKEVEVYSESRFFTVTGWRLEDCPAEIEPRQEQLEALCGRLFSRMKPAPLSETTGGGFPGTDDELLQAAFEAKKGDAVRKLYGGDTSAYGEDDSAADMALCSHLAFWTGRDAARIDRIFRGSGLFRAKWDRQDYRERTIERAIGLCTEVYRGHTGAAGGTLVAVMDSGDLPQILIGPDEHRVLDETIVALGADENLYQRGSMLVRVVRVRKPGREIRRAVGSTTIARVPAPNLRDRMTKVAAFFKLDSDGEPVRVHPRGWIVSGVESRGDWPDLRQLSALSEVPVLRADGSVWQTTGYDAETGVLFTPSRTYPPVPEYPTLADAKAAVEVIDEAICDFPFQTPAHKAAWLAALLTPLARAAYDGPTPLFLVDSNVRGAGKGLLTHVIGSIVLGHEMPISSYSHEPEEMRKKLTTIAIAADSVILLDNLAGLFGNEALDRALTSTRWKDRVLGKNDQVDLPFTTVFFATGNNVAVAADTARRIIHIRIEVMEEKPEERHGFKHPDLLAWVWDNRPRLLVAALTILSAYCRAGRPRQDLKPFGSFEGWSDLVRQAVVWVGCADPCQTRVMLTETADTARETLEQVLAALRLFDPEDEGVLISDAMSRLYPGRDDAPKDEASAAMRAAFEVLCGTPPGKVPSAKLVGTRLRGFRRRVVGGLYLDTDAQKKRAGVVWRVKGRGANQ